LIERKKNNISYVNIIDEKIIIRIEFFSLIEIEFLLNSINIIEVNVNLNRNYLHGVSEYSILLFRSGWLSNYECGGKCDLNVNHSFKK
jgi:hypothetical protein